MSGPTLSPWKRLVLPALGILLAILVVINWNDLKCRFLGLCPELRPGMSLVKCPGHPFQLELEPTEHVGAPRVLTTQALAGARAVITEVQDCQRLVVSDAEQGLAFGPLAALFASDQLATQFDAPPGATGTFGDDRAAAQIYSNGPYSPLGIREGSSCLYIAKVIRPAEDTTAQAVGFTARMEPAFADDDCLTEPHRKEGTTLEVRTISHSFQGLPGSDLPIAARWAGGGRVGPHYISIRCGDAWCEVGPWGFQSEQPPPQLERWNASSDARWAIPGWYDQQHLAVAHTEPNTNKVTLVPSPVRATIMPHPMLGTFNDKTTFEQDWVEVAYAWLPDEVEGYAGKMNFKPRWNRIAYRHGAQAQALGEGVEPKRPCPEEPTGEGDWWARVTAADGTEAFFCVTRFPHTGLDLPGVVRWRWMEEDETTWIRCPSGCCPVQ